MGRRQNQGQGSTQQPSPPVCSSSAFWGHCSLSCDPAPSPCPASSGLRPTELFAWPRSCGHSQLCLRARTTFPALTHPCCPCHTPFTTDSPSSPGPPQRLVLGPPLLGHATPHPLSPGVLSQRVPHFQFYSRSQQVPPPSPHCGSWHLPTSGAPGPGSCGGPSETTCWAPGDRVLTDLGLASTHRCPQTASLRRKPAGPALARPYPPQSPRRPRAANSGVVVERRLGRTRPHLPSCRELLGYKVIPFRVENTGNLCLLNIPDINQNDASLSQRPQCETLPGRSPNSSPDHALPRGPSQSTEPDSISPAANLRRVP